jgi:hypothetical protein
MQSHDFLGKLDWKDPAGRITFNMQYANVCAKPFVRIPQLLSFLLLRRLCLMLET